MNSYDHNLVIGMPFLECPIELHFLKPNMPGVYGILWGDVLIYEYVGQAKCLRNRLSNHEHGFLNCRFQILAWNEPGSDIDLLEERLAVEARFITKFILDGHELLNKCSYALKARAELKRRQRKM
jgi:hypothetical protein